MEKNRPILVVNAVYTQVYQRNHRVNQPKSAFQLGKVAALRISFDFCKVGFHLMEVMLRLRRLLRLRLSPLLDLLRLRTEV